MADLARALELFRRWRGDPSQSADDLLGEHPDLQEFLAPLVGEGSDAGTGEGDAPGLGSIGDYDLVAELGRGGMGVVYEARDRRLGRRVALKVLASVAGDERALARFRREATTMAALDHPGIVEVYGVGEEDGRSYYAMELVPGVSLDRVLDRLRRRADRNAHAVRSAIESVARRTAPRVAPTTGAEARSGQGLFEGSMVQCAARIGAAVARALGHAHAHGVLHRDIKPANVLITAGGRVALTDFGLARASGAPSITMTGQFAGTPYYVAPEQARGEWDRVGPASDVFSLSATLYELLMLERPFEAASAQMVLMQICDPRPVPASERLTQRVPKDLAAIVLKGLEKSPGNRYPDAGAMADDLEAFLAHRPVSARRPGPLRRALRWSRREPVKAALVATLLVGSPILAGLGGYLLAVAPAIDLGEREIERREWDRRVASAFSKLFYGGDFTGGEQAFAQMARERPDDLDVVIIHALRNTTSLSQLLDEHPDILARSPMLQWVVDRVRSDALEPWLGRGSAAEHHAVGHVLFFHGREVGRDDWVRLGLGHLVQANLLAERPSEAYLTAMVHCAASLGDTELVDYGCRALDEHFPDSVSALLTRAHGLRLHRREEAYALTRRALAATPDNYLAHGRLGELHHEDRELDAARSCFEKVLELAPGEPVALENLARLALIEGDVDAAANWCDQLAVADGNGWRSLHVRGKIAVAQEDLPRALELLREAWSRSNSQLVLSDLAVVAIRDGQAETAEKLLAPLVQAGRASVPVLQRYAEAMASQDRMDAAFAALEALPPGAEPVLLRLRGSIAGKLKRWDRCVADYTRALELAPMSVPHFENLVIALGHLDQIDRAAEVLAQARAAHPTDANIHGWSIDVFVRLGDPVAIVSEWRRFAAEHFRRGNVDLAIRRLAETPPPPGVPESDLEALHDDLRRYRQAAAGG